MTTEFSPGTRLGPYTILRYLGAGGMGDVFLARHEKLRRHVAIKVLPPKLARDRAGLARFEREARTASALNHPNIVTIHDIGEHQGTTYIAMELVEGRTLRDVIRDGPLPIERILEVGIQIADGMVAAHGAGIVHRDLKPPNVMVTDRGLVKILDFGLAKPLRALGGFGATTVTRTGEGLIAGTPHYMSPEQWSGDPVDHRSDQFAFGVILYEMACGAPPFDGPTVEAVMSAVLTRPAPSMRKARPDMPADLARLVSRCLEKDPSDRYDRTEELASELRAWRDRRVSSGTGLRPALRRPVVFLPAAVLILAVVLGAGLWATGVEERWAEGKAAAEVERLIESGDLYRAYRLGRRALAQLPDDPELTGLMERITLPAAVNTEPPGAEVWVKGYHTPDAPFERLGATPLSIRIPYALLRLRITRDGYEPFEGAPFGGGSLRALARGLVLDPAGLRPEGMVRVPAGILPGLPDVPSRGEEPLARLESFYLDRYEVTNRQFQRFVDAGGYQNPEWWPGPLERAGVTVPWRRAVAGFRDRTGRPGPAGWQLGRYPEGRAEHPVRGISWFEAAAYCAYTGKSLPTLYHWSYAVGQDQLSDILVLSNIGGVEDGPVPVGSYPGLAAFGTYDMAGNVKEWSRNATGDLRYLLGGAWNEPGYMFRHLVGKDPWSRDPTSGVRCALYPETVAPELTAPLELERRRASREPVDNAAFELIRGLYAYDRGGLQAQVDTVDDSLPHYRRETVSFRTAYRSERMQVHLLIPHDAAPPYQSVVWFPGSDVFALRSSDRLSSSFLVDFVPRTGRVLVHPVYYGMYERFENRPSTPLQRRDATIRWAKDLRRTIDYLETRPDFDAERIGFYGFSLGASLGPLFTAIEPRIATAVLLGAGFPPRLIARPEVDQTNFLTRSHTSTLMINGRDDFLLPYETAQRPFFEMLGAAGEDKRHARLTGGHIPERVEIIREVLDWLDRHLGPVAASHDLASGAAQRH